MKKYEKILNARCAVAKAKTDLIRLGNLCHEFNDIGGPALRIYYHTLAVYNTLLDGANDNLERVKNEL